MPPKTKKAASTEPSTDDEQNGGDGEICEESAVTTAMADMTMFSTQNVQNIIETLQRSQTEALKELLQSVSSRTTSCTAQGQGTLTGCKTTFSGQPQESVEAFIDAVDAYSECAQVSDTNVLRGLAYLLKENAATWWQGVKQQITSWQQAKENLISAYGDRRPPHRIYIEIFSSPQQTENTDVFVARIRSLFARLPEGDISEKAQLDMTYGLLSSRIRKRLRREDVASFKELLRRARSVEDSFDEGERKQTPPQAANRAVTSNQRAPPASTTTARTGTSHASGAPAATAPPRAPQSSALAQPRTSPTPTQPAVAQGPGTGITTTVADASVKKQRPVCAYCRRFGHSKDQCRKLMNSGESTSNNNTANSANVRPISETSDISFYSVDFNSCNVASKNRTQNAYFSMSDTCSNLSLILHSNKVENGTTHDCYEYDVPRSNMIPACTTTATTGEKCLHSFVPKADKNITGATNSLQTTNPHSCNEQFRCRGPLSSITVPTCSSNYSVISSEDARKCSMTDSREQNEFYLTNGRNPLLCVNNNNRPCNNNEYSPFASKCINPSNSGDVTEVDTFFGADCGKISDDELIYLYMTYVDGDCETVGRTTRPIFNIEILGVKGTGLVDTGAKRNHPLHTITRNIKLADGVSRAMEVLVTVLEVRLEQEIVKIPFLIFPYATNNETLLGIDFLTAAGVDIDFLELVWCFSRNRTVQYKLCFEPTSPSVTCATTNVLRDDEGSHLTPAERQALAGVLTRHAHVFTPGGAPTPYAEHRIETGENPPIAVPPYRLNPAKKELMKKKIDKMLRDDIIEECESAWSSPALMVPKANGEIRFCVDYRRLNAITKSDTYPMPRIDDLLQNKKRDCYMSTLDLRSSYWQVMLREADRDKSSFVCPLGTFRFKRMPFGLKNAPATFQRLIDRLRSCSALKDVTVLAYLDDLLVISEGYQRHLQDLEAVFKRLAEFNLHVNREKCAFARESVKYLGHVITQQGVSTDPDKVSAVLEMKEPGTLKHLRTFLQTCSWFRKFIPNFSKVSEPLTRLTRKNQVWIWGSEQTQAFLELKRLLTTAPILVQADFSRPFILRTDSSNYALGAVLLQGDGNEERPIEYASRLLNAAERNYSTTEREALAVVWAVERFRPYLDGQPVVIGSDHQPLRWLLSLKSPAGRLVRWALRLQAFDIRFEYTPGKANVVADTLSRPVCSGDSREDCGVYSVVFDLPTKNPAELRREQLADPEVEKIVKEVEGSNEVASRRWTERGYLMEQGVLYRYNPDSDSETPQLVIPISLRAEILKECHDSPVAGHPGVDRTYQKIAQLYYFTGMRRIITDYVKACIHCQRYKAINTKPPGLLQTPLMNQRNEVLAMDLFGPLPPGDQGERWIFLVEDTATRWTELYALKDATAEACAVILVEEYFMRFGLPRRVISDNGVQFISAVMRQCMAALGIKQNLAPLYHPEANPAERKNRDMKPMLAQLVEEDHTSWPRKLPVIRFALNSARCRTTGKSPAYLTFGREMRSPTEVIHDLRAILGKDNFVPQITPYLQSFLNSLSGIRERVEIQQDKAKEYADASRRPSEEFEVGDLVLLKSHLVSNTSKDVTAKFLPRRDGPYVITEKVSPTTYSIASIDQPDISLGRYHTQDLTRYRGNDGDTPRPVVPKRNRGRPPNTDRNDRVLVQERGRSPGLEGEHIANRVDDTNGQTSTAFKLPARASRGQLPARYTE
ncbi:uncharacterized protein LOC133530409 [Cydia pomonella]|uniref:uncharacterized protein LOC133530409 n=1 Tax=Cydia pomonella TaxID=82600 RepID=UPI002ADD9203|nr:uncharacterized protein LOC133530409 [Cydia pomonella]